MTAQSLVEWYRLHARTLPWRKDVRDPYHIVVSEFMLQQTQVDRVVSRFESFVRRFPDFAALAAAGEDDVVEEWSGLGYYRRARMLHQLARAVADSGGALPASATELEQLPGIGPYTAAAVASLAWDEAVPVLDGNTMRVGARVLALDVDPRSAEGRRRLGTWILSLMEHENPGEVNEALMELGATVCTPADPGCSECPMTTNCLARRTSRQLDYPPPRRRRATVDLLWTAACCVDDDGRWLVRLVDDGPILRGLWLPPLIEIENPADAVPAATDLLPANVISSPRVGAVVRHHITHRRIDVISVFFDAERRDPTSALWRWVDPLNPGVPTSSLLEKLARVSTD
ncbi:MAG: A/G-specific adenine glycosylase [Acidobacteriota bacterium]|nr:A/G-specific adenine glycosylase [Acidobacteriota bacterium]